jgi:SpoVK/Ycf46/Vps4 family AAA+-type ATPase
MTSENKTFYIKSGDKYAVETDSDIQISDKLEPGTYTLVTIPFQGFRLQKSKDIDFTGKVYGDVPKVVERLWRTFKSRDKSTGFLLNGDKGTGKTMTTKLLCRKAKDDGKITVIINSPFAGEDFNRLISLLPEESIILFDEFEKVYSKEEFQNPILSLLDGLYSSKKMFLLTINDMSKMNQFLLNRPGRLFYNVKFPGLDDKFVREYSIDKLDNQKYVEEVVSLLEFVEPFSFDMLQAVIEEVNRYDERPVKTLDWLNIRKTYKRNTFKIKQLLVPTDDILRVATPQVSMTAYENGNEDGFHIEYVSTEKEDVLRKVFNKDTKEYEENMVSVNKNKSVYFSVENSKGIRTEDKVYVYQTDDGARVELVKVKEKPYHWTTNLIF